MESPAVIETDALINSRKIGRPQIVVGVLGACALFVEGFDTSAIGYIAPQIRQDWSLSPDTLGTQSSGTRIPTAGRSPHVAQQKIAGLL